MLSRHPGWMEMAMVAILASTLVPAAQAAELYVGAAETCITPDRPVALAGQMHTRIARQVESPVTATALALESRVGDQVREQSILIACDVVAIRGSVLEKVRQRVAQRIPGFDVSKVVLSATHTHTAPVLREGTYVIPDDVMQPAEYVEFFADRVSEAAVQAWESRQPGGMGYGIGFGVVAYNRRPFYADGRAQMYGPTNTADFRGLEGFEDHGIEILFFFDRQEQLLATAINVAGPAQEVEGRSAINADYWHPVREMLRERHGQHVMVLGWTGAAGDQSPRPMFRRQAEERMRRLRGLDSLQELARRIVQAWEDVYAVARLEINTEPALAHRVQTLQLPVRRVTDDEAARARQQAEQLLTNERLRARMRWYQAVVDRYQQQQQDEAMTFATEVHVLRLGEVAIATNQFELFTDFGVQIKGRSPAVQTFIIQLAGAGTYLPTERAVRGGGYSAVVESSQVGPAGGQVLVQETVATIQELFDE